MVAAIESHFPQIRADGVPAGSRLMFVVDSRGQVQSARLLGPDAAPANIALETIARMEVFKGGSGITVGGHPVDVIWITTKA